MPIKIANLLKFRFASKDSSSYRRGTIDIRKAPAECDVCPSHPRRCGLRKEDSRAGDSLDPSGQHATRFRTGLRSDYEQLPPNCLASHSESQESRLRRSAEF